MQFGLSSETIARIQAVFAHYADIKQAVIYGSRARGNFRAGSDIDLTLIGENLTETQLSEIYWKIDELDTPYLIDLSLFHRLTNRDLIANIEREGQVFYQKQGTPNGKP